jgi:hypothetical protein
MSSQFLSDRLLEALKNNRFIAITIVVTTVIVAVATFTSVVGSSYKLVSELFGLDGRARSIYRPLVADLENLDGRVNALGSLLTPGQPRDNIRLAPDMLHMVEVASEPVCAARKGVFEFGDADIRKELDEICLSIESLKPLLNINPVLPILGAAAIEAVGEIKKLREKLLSRL